MKKSLKNETDFREYFVETEGNKFIHKKTKQIQKEHNHFFSNGMERIHRKGNARNIPGNFRKRNGTDSLERKRNGTEPIFCSNGTERILTALNGTKQNESDIGLFETARS